MSELSYEGQSFIFNHERHVIKLVIRKTFRNAGSLLEWDPKYGKKGIGINKSIISLLIKTKSNLIIRLEEEQKEYRIKFDKIEQFLKNNKTEHRVNKHRSIHHIPLMLLINQEKKNES